MTTTKIAGIAGLAFATALLAGCSATGDDPRVAFCKNLVAAQLGNPAALEWTGGENTFKRPEFATTGLTYAVEDTAGGSRDGSAACYFEYDAIEDTAQHLADPLSAYSTLPFAMTLDGRMLSDAELVAARTAEQKRQGMAVLGALEQGARDMADQVRASLGQ
jgi:hypothetical protein